MTKGLGMTEGLGMTNWLSPADLPLPGEPHGFPPGHIPLGHFPL